MKAKFYAVDANNVLQHPSPSDFTISEDGVTRKVTGITCPSQSSPAYTLGLMFDTHSGRDLAQAAAKKFLNFLPLPPSEAGMTIMDNGAYILQDITQKKSKLLNAISYLAYSMTTDLQTMFYGQVAGGVKFVSGRPNKKALVLITDLHCPLYNLDKSKLFADCRKEHINVYTVLVNASDYNGYFKEIADSTGGAVFEIINEAQAENVFLRLSNDLGTIPPCEITWESEGSCVAVARNVSFNWNSVTANDSYSIPKDNIAQLQTSPISLYIFGKPVNVKFDTTVTITAISSAFSISNITSSNPLYDISPKSFSLAKGETKKLTITYTPPDSSYTWTDFTITTDRCTQYFYASSSYPGTIVQKSTPSIKLIKPNGGETYQTGSDTLITWTGIPPTDTVSLAYSLDSGQSWNVITTQATGGSYLWHLPQKTSTKCLISVTQFVRSASNFLIRCGGTGSEEEAKSVVTDNAGNIYVTGAADGQTDFGGVTLTSNVGQQAFVAKYSSSGSLLWVKYIFKIFNGGGCVGNGICLDPDGNILLTGYLTGSGPFIFKQDTISFTSFGVVDLFTAKLFADGSPDWIQVIKGPPSGVFGQGQGITTDGSGNVYTTGYYGDSALIGNVFLKGYHYWDIFIVKYLPDGTVDWAHRAGNIDFDKGNSVAVDKAGFVYVAGSFQDKGDFDGIKPNNSGQIDAFIAKYNPDGSIGWVKAIGGLTNDEGNGIAIDPTGYLIVTGEFSGTVDFGGTTLSTKGGNYDMFVAKFLPDGTLVWVRQAGGVNSTIGKSISADASGNIYVTGSLSGTADFGTQTLTTAGGLDAFVAKYASDGTFQWAQRAGGQSGDDQGDAITVDRFGNIYCTGFTRGDADFSGLPSTHIGSFQDLFIWKIGIQSPLQSDISDTLFSIIAPTFSFSTNSIDMGQVQTGQQKDSVVKATICNLGNLPLHVLGMDMTGGAAMEFMIMSGAGDFTLAPGECRDVMFTFMPMMIGKMSATITLRTANGNYPDTIKILGEGIAPVLQVMSDVIDFGQLNIGASKDTIITIALKNIGNLPVNFTTTSQLGPDIKQFSIQSGSAPFTLASGASQTVTLRFSPHYIGRTSGRIAFDYGSSSPAILSLFGQGIGGLVVIKADSGYAGDHKNIPMILEKVPISSVQSAATNFSARIAYDKTVLYSSGSVQHGNRYDTLTVSGSLTSTDTLAFIPFTAMLGESTSSPMNIVDFAWLDGAGQPADFDAETGSGTFYMLGICPAGGTRLYNPDGQVSMAHITPNPTNGIMHIDIQTTEVGRTQVSLVNLLGATVAKISDGELKPGAHSFELNTNTLSAGSYFLMMQTPTVRKMQRVDVEK